jgi:hypothetical protein
MSCRRQSLQRPLAGPSFWAALLSCQPSVRRRERDARSDAAACHGDWGDGVIMDARRQINPPKFECSL